MSTDQLPGTDEKPGDNPGGPHNFNVSLSNTHYIALTAIAMQEGMTKVQVLRRLIANAELMFIHNVPVCVTGARCFCPERQAPPQTAPHQNIIAEHP